MNDNVMRCGHAFEDHSPFDTCPDKVAEITMLEQRIKEAEALIEMLEKKRGDLYSEIYKLEIAKNNLLSFLNGETMVIPTKISED